MTRPCQAARQPPPSRENLTVMLHPQSPDWPHPMQFTASMPTC
ncbi:hypothetical protein FHS28_003300 [Roseateles terrae]|uniref:Uncharacterized protein n=1 Tax=Roseateles terrae TaxID=431060 RepID=A0ABR6GUV1_9BURK|nr:hypothetical protein [Roseateles terrae]